jgi:hypothetical protein
MIFSENPEHEMGCRTVRRATVLFPEEGLYENDPLFYPTNF